MPEIGAGLSVKNTTQPASLAAAYSSLKIVVLYFSFFSLSLYF